MTLMLNSPKDVREFIKEFIVKLGSGELEGVKHPGVIVQSLNCWLKCWELEQSNEIEKRIIALEKRSQERCNHERQSEYELD
jgi:hypothetical protein